MTLYRLGKSIILSAFILSLSFSCMDDLDRFPENETTGEDVYSTFDGYFGAMVKVYSSFALSGNEGPAGKPDISGLDEGQYADFLRMFFNHQELPTDEAHCIWQDEGIPGLNNINFSSENPFSKGMYNRCIMNIMYANEFLRNSSPDELSLRNFFSFELEESVFSGVEFGFLGVFHFWVFWVLFVNPLLLTEDTGLDI